jgi:hypothetical protein
VYDVLNTLTSYTNGTPPAPTTDAATGNVTVSPARGVTPASNRAPAARRELPRALRILPAFIVVVVTRRI